MAAKDIRTTKGRGKLYDSTGSYDVVWWIAVALGVFAGLVNLPVRESPIVRPAAVPA